MRSEAGHRSSVVFLPIRGLKKPLRLSYGIWGENGSISVGTGAFPYFDRDSAPQKSTPIPKGPLDVD